MSDRAEMFRKLARKQEAQTSDEVPLPSISPLSAEQPPAAAPTQPADPQVNRKRGRPATGKRSDPEWIGRTYYIRRGTDLDVEDELLHLKRQGIDLDKSELVDSLLIAWAKWRQGEDSDFLLSEISPRRKSDS